MLIFIALSFLFAAFTLVFLQFMPQTLESLKTWQEKKVVESAKKLDDAFMLVPRKKLLFFHILSPILLGGLGFFIAKGVSGIAAGIAIGVVLPQIAVKNYEKMRRQKFKNQLVDGLMILSGSLKAGLSLLQSFEALVEEMPAPIAEEFNLLLRENRMGTPIEDCLIHLRKRMRLEELDLIITAILVARETGGDLTSTFSQLVFTIREKDKLVGKVKALTIQGRLQGIIMSILPVGFAVFAFKTNPRFFDIMVNDKIGQALLIYCGISYIIGIWLIKLFSKVEV